jgi:DNA-binding MarR family transcriptional regulator
MESNQGSNDPQHESDLLRDATQLRRAVSLMARVLRRLRSEHRLSGSKLIILGHLYRESGPMTATELAKRERLQPQSLTRIISELAERALIKRKRDPSDRRQLLLEITQRGKDLIVVDAQRQSKWLASAIERSLTRTERHFVTAAAELLNTLAHDNQRESEDVGRATEESEENTTRSS